MRIPTEDEIQVQLSDLAAHSTGENDCTCEFCQLFSEFDKRSKRYGDSICHIDNIAQFLSGRCAIFPPLIASPIGSEIISILTDIARTAFLVGLKTGIAQRDMDSFDLESLAGGENQ